jgi:hypothetical protein
MVITSEGIVCCAVGPSNYLNEAIACAESVRRFCPNISISLFTDNPKFNHPIFTNIFPVQKQPGFFAKIDAMSQCIYTKTLFLDTDTVVIKNCIPQLFELLDRFDIALTHAPFWQGGCKNPNIPICFPEFNTGVILYNSKIRYIFDLWKTTYQNKFKNTHDQPALREVLYKNKVNLYVLPPEFNVRPFSYDKNDRDHYILHWHGAASQVQEKWQTKQHIPPKTTIF